MFEHFKVIICSLINLRISSLHECEDVMNSYSQANHTQQLALTFHKARYLLNDITKVLHVNIERML